AEDVLAGFGRPDRPLGMERVRERVVDRVDVRRGQHGVVAAGPLGAELRRRGARPTRVAAPYDRERVPGRVEPRQPAPHDPAGPQDAPAQWCHAHGYTSSGSTRSLGIATTSRSRTTMPTWASWPIGK